MAENPLADPLEPPPDIGAVPNPPFGGKPPRRAAVAFIFVTALIDIIAIGVIVPVLPKLVQGFTGDPGKAAQIFGLFGATFAVMQFFASPVLGALSDRFGRRPVLLISIFGLGLDYVLMALAPNLWWLFLGRIISGCCAASFSTANAYIADVTPPAQRAKAFGLMGSAFGIGFIAGPLMGGLLAQYLGPHAPFWGAALLALINGLYGLFVLPESLPKDRRAPFRIKNANPLGSLRLYARSTDLLMLAGVTFLFYLAHQVLQSTFVLYTSTRYGWDALLLGVSLAITGVGSIIVQAFVIGPTVKRFKERGALYIGLFCGFLGMAWYATAWTGVLYWLGAPVFALMGLVGPGINGLMSRRVSPTEQGRLQGANAGLMALAGMVGPIMFTEIFAWSIKPPHHAPGVAVYVAAGLLACALLLAWRTPHADPKTTAIA